MSKNKKDDEGLENEKRIEKNDSCSKRETTWNKNDNYTVGFKTERKSNKPKIAGSLLVIAAVLGMLFSVLMIGSGFFIEDADDWMIIGENKIDIEGKVLDSDQTVIEGVEVSIEGTDQSAITDSTGYYKINNIEAGYHEIRIDKEGYETITFESFLPFFSIGFNDDNKKVYGAGQLEIKDGKEFDFIMDEGTGAVTYGRDEDTTDKLLEGVHGTLTIIGIIVLICSIIALIGGISSIKRGNYSLAIVGGIAGIFSFGFLFGTILAVIALLLLILSSDSFKRDLKE